MLCLLFFLWGVSKKRKLYLRAIAVMAKLSAKKSTSPPGSRGPSSVHNHSSISSSLELLGSVCCGTLGGEPFLVPPTFHFPPFRLFEDERGERDRDRDRDFERDRERRGDRDRERPRVIFFDLQFDA